MKLTTLTIAGLLIAGSLHAQEITAYDLGLSNADLLKPQIENRLTIQRHREEERIVRERKHQHEIDMANAYYYAAMAKGAAIREMREQWNREDNEKRNLRALEGIQRELQDQTQILRDARDHGFERSHYFSNCGGRW